MVSSGLVVLVNGLMGLMAKKMLNDFLGEWVSNDANGDAKSKWANSCVKR